MDRGSARWIEKNRIGFFYLVDQIDRHASSLERLCAALKNAGEGENFEDSMASMGGKQKVAGKVERPVDADAGKGGERVGIEGGGFYGCRFERVDGGVKEKGRRRVGRRSGDGG